MASRGAAPKDVDAYAPSSEEPAEDEAEGALACGGSDAKDFIARSKLDILSWNEIPF